MVYKYLINPVYFDLACALSNSQILHTHSAIRSYIDVLYVLKAHSGPAGPWDTSTNRADMDKITTGKYEQTPKVSLFQDVFQPKFE